MKAKVLITFKDLKEKKLRHAGEVFECTEERFEEIIKANRLVEAVGDGADGAGDTLGAAGEEVSDEDAKPAGAAADDATGASEGETVEAGQTAADEAGVTETAVDETETAQVSETQKKTRKTIKKAAKKTED